MDMYYLEEDLVLDEEEEKVEEESIDLKHETAVITPELIEKSKQVRLKNEESKRAQPEGTTEDTEEEDWDDFSEDIILNIKTEHVSDDRSASFGDF